MGANEAPDHDSVEWAPHWRLSSAQEVPAELEGSFQGRSFMQRARRRGARAELESVSSRSETDCGKWRNQERHLPDNRTQDNLWLCASVASCRPASSAHAKRRP